MKPLKPRARMTKVIRQAERVIRDVQSYNKMHPESVPLDCEWEKCLVKFALRCRDALDSNFQSRFGPPYRELMEYLDQ